MRYRPIAERFWEKVKMDGPIPPHRPDLGQCWIWTAARNGKGYGIIMRHKPRGPALAHRISHELNIGPVPDGVFVCHHCDNPPCVNPKHFFLGKHRENTNDMISKGRYVPGVLERSKTHCPQGHPYEGSNLSVRANGSRHCKACRRVGSPVYRRPDREKVKRSNREYRAVQKAKDPEGFRQRERERHARYKAKNPQEFLRRQREYSRAYEARKAAAGR